MTLYKFKFMALLCAVMFVVLGPRAFSDDTNWTATKTIDGHPDLQGVWGNNTITPLQRPEFFGDKEFLTDEDVEFLTRRISEIQAEGSDALFTDGVLQAAFSGEVQSYDPTTGNYDSQWMVDRTVHARTSLITDPPNGRLPKMTDEASALAKQAETRQIEHPADSWSDRPLGERCITFGAPDIWLSGYNSYWHIVQSKNSIAIVQEKIHDVRIIPIVEKPKLDGKISLWHGDSRGWWDGETLVIETTNFSGKADLLHSVSAAGQQIRGPGPRASERTYTERITRVGKNAIRYEITSSDPGTYQRPYTVEMTLDYTEDPIYEYACHEGNYGMANILSGHRAQERFAAESGSQN